MPNYAIRQATLDDTGAVVALARAGVGVWQRMDDDGQVQDVAYDDLTVYERWLHGGPWMTIETGALQMGRLLLGAGLPLVAEAAGEVVGYAEIYRGTEPQPYGRHLHIATLMSAADSEAAEAALVQAVLERGREYRFSRVSTNLAANDSARIRFYEGHGMARTDEIRRMTLPAKQGQVFYKALEHPDDDPAQVDGWFLNIGRLGSARSQWESLWHKTWETIPQVQARKTHRLKMNAAGNDAFVLVRQQLYLPRSADVFAWTPKPPTGQLLTAIRDWAHREGYRKLVMPTVESGVKTLGLDAEPDGYREYVYTIDL